VPEPRYYASAQHVAGDCAAIAYTVEADVLGPNGETKQSLLLVTRDRGATWTSAPLVRTIWSNLRFWGYPVWPPESIDAVEIDDASLRIRFRDEWVPFEPGGESLWSGLRRSSDLWTVARIRLMDYDGDDSPAWVAPIEVSLPPEFAAPSQAQLSALASRIAADRPSSAYDRHGWLLAIPCAAPFAVWGASWRSLAATIVMLAALPITSILLARRRCRRANAG
jgi:hypothetical protein